MDMEERINFIIDIGSGFDVSEEYFVCQTLFYIYYDYYTLSGLMVDVAIVICNQVGISIVCNQVGISIVCNQVGNSTTLFKFMTSNLLVLAPLLVTLVG